MVLAGVVILRVAVLSVCGAKERLTASVGLVWSINIHHLHWHTASPCEQRRSAFSEFFLVELLGSFGHHGLWHFDLEGS